MTQLSVPKLFSAKFTVLRVLITHNFLEIHVLVKETLVLRAHFFRCMSVMALNFLSIRCIINFFLGKWNHYMISIGFKDARGFSSTATKCFDDVTETNSTILENISKTISPCITLAWNWSLQEYNPQWT